MNAALDIVRVGLGGAICAIGLALMLGGAIGLLRFPDVYTRLHAASVSNGAGALLTLCGLAVASGDGAIALRLLVLGALLMAIAPTLNHLVASAAHASGVTPIAGAYSAPRPGATRAGGSP